MKNAVESITSLDFLQGNVYAILFNLFTLKIRDVIRLIYILDNSSKKNYGLGFKGSPSRKKKNYSIMTAFFVVVEVKRAISTSAQNGSPGRSLSRSMQ